MIASDAHRSVLLKEAIEFLNIKPAGRYVDATLGLAGHAVAIADRLGPDGRLLGLDVDPDNLSIAKDRLQLFGNRTNTRRSNFRGLQEVLSELGWSSIDGILFDLGVSSTQLDIDARGFSFQKEGPLDMRLDPASPATALSILQSIDEQALFETLVKFGEGRYARKLSRGIIRFVGEGKIQTTRDLAKTCERIVGWRRGSHPATRVFLALRCLVNSELEAIERMLCAVPQMLNVGGRWVVISFHSLEDRLIKEKFRELALSDPLGKQFRVLTKKPIVPSENEIRENPRSRSAKLRALERIS